MEQVDYSNFDINNLNTYQTDIEGRNILLRLATWKYYWARTSNRGSMRHLVKI